MCRCGMGPVVLSLCSHILHRLLHAILAAWVTDGQAGVVWNIPPLFLPRKGWGPWWDGYVGAVWALCLLSGHPESGVEDLHGGDGDRLRTAAPGGSHGNHGMLCYDLISRTIGRVAGGIQFGRWVQLQGAWLEIQWMGKWWNGWMNLCIDECIDGLRDEKCDC